MYSTLFGLGYSAAPQRTPQGKLTGNLSIIKPNGDVYSLVLSSAVCSCKAGQRGVNCKHRRDAARLSHDSYITLRDTDNISDAYSLALVWAKYVTDAANPFPDYLLPFLHCVSVDLALHTADREQEEAFLLSRSMSGNTDRDNELPALQSELDRLARITALVRCAYDKLRNIAACPSLIAQEGLKRAA